MHAYLETFDNDASRETSFCFDLLCVKTRKHRIFYVVYIPARNRAGISMNAFLDDRT